MTRHVLNFKAQFAELVSSETKRQTIRAVRERPIAAGDELRLYTGMRTKACRLLGVATCEGVCEITIRESVRFRIWTAMRTGGDRRWLTAGNEAAFAQADGFPSQFALMDFFRETHGLPFEGVVIRWGDLRA